MPLLDCINQISKYTMCMCGGKPAGLFSHILFDIERVVPFAIIRRKFSASKFKSPAINKIQKTMFLLLEAGTRVADVPHSFG